MNSNCSRNLEGFVWDRYVLSLGRVCFKDGVEKFIIRGVNINVEIIFINSKFDLFCRFRSVLGKELGYQDYLELREIFESAPLINFSLEEKSI